MTKVVYFQPAYNGDFQDTLENAKAAAPYVDHFVVVADASKYHEFSHDQKLELQNVGTNVVRVDFDWEESLPKMYQHGVQAALELKADWICFSDADEHFNEAFFKDLKSKLIPSLEQKGYDMAGIKCHAQFAIADAVWPSSLSVETTAGVMDLDKVPEKVVVTNDHKYMLMKLYPDLKWEGVGRTQTVHTTWNSASHPWKAIFLPDEYWYLHRKTPLQVYSSAARNMFMSGGGANLGDVNAMWVELKNLMASVNVNTWPEFERYIQGDGGSPAAIVWGQFEDWVTRALTWKATDYGTETRQTALWILYYHRYFLKNPEIAAGVAHPPQVDDSVRAERKVQELYLGVLGRWPDKEGLDRYTQALLSKQWTPEEVKDILERSDEYKARERHAARTASGGRQLLCSSESRLLGHPGGDHWRPQPDQVLQRGPQAQAGLRHVHRAGGRGGLLQEVLRPEGEGGADAPQDSAATGRKREAAR